MDDVINQLERLVKPKHTVRNTVLGLLVMLVLTAIAAVALEFRKVPSYKSADELPE